jgi:Bifunctional DNA primase/polymerase, N-terminal
VSDLARAALAYASQGSLYVFPVRPRGKTPLTAHGLHNATTDPATVRAMWEKWPDANIGVDCGRSGRLVVDVEREGRAGWADLAAAHGGHEPTLTARTGGGGYHLHFAAPQNAAWARSTAGRLAQHVDTRGRGGYALPGPERARERNELPLA